MNRAMDERFEDEIAEKSYRPPLTNREKIARAMDDIESVMKDDAISPTPYEHFYDACTHLRAAYMFVLDLDERDGISTKVEL